MTGVRFRLRFGRAWDADRCRETDPLTTGVRWRVPSVQEYWMFDNRDDSDWPTLRVYRRGWVILDYGPDETYTTPLLPDFQLPVTPSDD